MQSMPSNEQVKREQIEKLVSLIMAAGNNPEVREQLRAILEPSEKKDREEHIKKISTIVDDAIQRINNRITELDRIKKEKAPLLLA